MTDIVINKVQKIALLITFHTQIVPLSEAELMVLIAWVVNGVDTGTNKEGKPRIDWTPYLEFAQAAHDQMYPQEDENETPEPVVTD